MKRIVEHKSRMRILTCFVLLVLIFFAKLNTATAFKELSSVEPIVIVQTQISGEWTAEFNKHRGAKHNDETEKIAETNRLHLNLKRNSDRGTDSFGSTLSLSEFQGLNDNQLLGNSNVNFSLQREAGTVQFEGTFDAGKGLGRFVFTPNQEFLSAMKNRGYTLNEEKQLAAAMLKVSVKNVDDLRNAGFQNLSLDDVFKATIFKITPQFVSEMNSIGLKNLEMEDLVKARIFKIDAAFAREVKEMGFGEVQPMETLVKMKIFKITPEFLREMRAAGLENLEIEDLVKLKIFKIDSAFIQRVNKSGNEKFSVEDLVKMKIHGRG